MKVIRNIGFVGAFALATMIQTGEAREGRSFGEIYTECGLWAMIFPETPAVAAVSNVTWDLGTTAISSNVSSPNSCKGGQTKMAALIYESYPSIEAELARGEGAYLDALAALAGISAEDKSLFIENVRLSFSTLVNEDSYVQQDRYEQSERLFDLVQVEINKLS